jgi:hypothetical protein
MPIALIWVSIAVLIAGGFWSLGQTTGEYRRMAEAADQANSLAPVLSAFFLFAWYFASNCFWAALLLAFGQAFEKLDQLVWPRASEADRREIVLRRGGAPKQIGNWRNADLKR